VEDAARRLYLLIADRKLALSLPVALRILLQLIHRVRGSDLFQKLAVALRIFMAGLGELVCSCPLSS
jgi:hypothetical protein